MPGFGRDGGTDRNPTPELIDAPDRAARGVRGGDGRRGAARSSTSTSTSRPRASSQVARALEPYDLAWLEVDAFDPARARLRPLALADPDLLRREPLHEPRLPAVPRGGRDGRRLGRRDLERLRPGEEDRRPRRDVRGRLRAAQLLQPPRDVHRRAVVRGDPERADPRGRRRRRPLARGADDRGARRSSTASSSSRPARAGAATSTRTCSPRTRSASSARARTSLALEPLRKPRVPEPELEARELRELVDDGVRDPAALPARPEPAELLAGVPRARPAERGARLVALDVRRARPRRRSRRSAGTRSATCTRASGGPLRRARRRARARLAGRVATTPDPRS